MEMEHIDTLNFHFIQTKLGGAQQGSARDILQFPGLVLQRHIKLSETSVRRQKIDFLAFEVRIEVSYCLFYFLCFSPHSVFSPAPTYYYLLFSSLLPLSDSAITRSVLCVASPFSDPRIQV